MVATSEGGRLITTNTGARQVETHLGQVPPQRSRRRSTRLCLPTSPMVVCCSRHRRGCAWARWNWSRLSSRRTRVSMKKQMRSLVGADASTMIVRMSRITVMAVELTGRDFPHRVASGWRRIRAGAQARWWQFDVTPQPSGIRVLQLRVAMRIPMPGRLDERLAIRAENARSTCGSTKVMPSPGSAVATGSGWSRRRSASRGDHRLDQSDPGLDACERRLATVATRTQPEASRLAQHGRGISWLSDHRRYASNTTHAGAAGDTIVKPRDLPH